MNSWGSFLISKHFKGSFETSEEAEEFIKESGLRVTYEWVDGEDISKHLKPKE